MHVDRAVSDDDLRAPDRGVDLLAGDEFPGRCAEQGQQFELLAGQREGFSVDGRHVALAVDGDARSRIGGAFSVGVYALENGLHAAYEQFHLDGLGQVVVGPDAESRELLLLLAQGREEHDHRVAQQGVFADGAAGLRTVHHRHHHVEQDQVRAALEGDLERFGAVFGRKDLVAFADEVVSHEFEDVDLVVDQ